MPDPRIIKYREQWALYWFDGKSRRALLKDENGNPVASREDAERVALDVQRTAMRPLGPLIGDLADKYFRDKRGRIHPGMEFAWKAIKAKVAHLRPEHITREWCQEYTEDARKKARSDGTIRKDLTVLNAICRWSNKATPAVIEMPPMPAPRNRHLTKPEAKKLIAGADRPHIRLFIILALQTAARHGALLELTWDRVDFTTGIIDLGQSETHNKKRAIVPMSRDARFALNNARKGALTDFVIEYAGGPVQSIKKGFANAAKRAELKDVTPHVLRHTAAVWMVEAGRPMAEVAQYLGHTSEAITFRVYARFTPTFLQGAASALDLDLEAELVPKSEGSVPNDEVTN